MLVTFALVLPIFVLIGAGYWMRLTRFLPDAFWPGAEKIGYWVLLPALIIQSLATRDVSGAAALPYVAVLVITVVALRGGLFLARRLLGLPGPAFGSLHQGTVRINGLLAFAVGLALIGPESIPLVALMFAVWIPLSNGISVYVFVRFAGEGDPRPLKIAWEVLSNPAIFSVIIGYALNLAGAGAWLEGFILLELLGRAALPLGLLAVGAALDLQALAAASRWVVSALGLKLLVMPLTTIGLAHAFGLDPLAGAVAVLCVCMPTSPGGYLVAKHLRGDATLMANIVTLQTAASVVTVTIFADYALGYLGR